jgi:hypothetical protein
MRRGREIRPWSFRPPLESEIAHLWERRRYRRWKRKRPVIRRRNFTVDFRALL